MNKFARGGTFGSDELSIFLYCFYYYWFVNKGGTFSISFLKTRCIQEFRGVGDDDLCNCVCFCL